MTTPTRLSSFDFWLTARNIRHEPMTVWVEGKERDGIYIRFIDRWPAGCDTVATQGIDQEAALRGLTVSIGDKGVCFY
jgi:hypothetical protein